MIPTFNEWLWNKKQQQVPSYRMTDAEARAMGLTPPPKAVAPKKPGFFSGLLGRPKQATVAPAVAQTQPAAQAAEPEQNLSDYLKDQWTRNHMGVTDAERERANQNNTRHWHTPEELDRLWQQSGGNQQEDD